MGLDEVLSDLEGESYAARAFIVPACAVDAPHRRDRVFIICRNVGNTENERYKQWSDAEREGAENKQEQRLGVRSEPSGSGEDVADTDSERLQGQWREHEFVSEREAEHSVGSSGEEVRAREYWKSEPSVGRVAHGIPRRVDRLKGLGNAIVPQIAMRIGMTIKEISKIPAQG
jgi:DNA (cytosine-5)-methyltransferase 1